MLAGASTVATLLPVPAWRAEGLFPPARDLVERGAAVALASNFNAHHTPTLSMQTVVALACLEMGLTPEQAISAATINGAARAGMRRPYRLAGTRESRRRDHTGNAATIANWPASSASTWFN